MSRTNPTRNKPESEQRTFWRALRDGFGSLLVLFPPTVSLRGFLRMTDRLWMLCKHGDAKQHWIVDDSERLGLQTQEVRFLKDPCPGGYKPTTEEVWWCEIHKTNGFEKRGCVRALALSLLEPDKEPDPTDACRMVKRLLVTPEVDE